MNDDHPLPYTLAGRMLLFLSLILPVAGTLLSIYISQKILAFERIPLTAIATPNVAMGFGLFVIGAAIRNRRCNAEKIWDPGSERRCCQT